MNNNNRNSNALLFLGGLAVGAAVGYFYNTPRGQKMKEDLINKGIDVKNTVVEKANLVKDEAKVKAKSVINKAADVMDNVQERFNDSASDALDVTEKRLNKLQKGIDKAKAAIQNGVA